MTNPLRVVVVGSGIGAQHVRAFRVAPTSSRLPRSAISIQRAQRRRRRARNSRTPHRFRAAIARTDVDIVDICTPPNLHFPQIRAAIEAGKHVICEKPLVGSLVELDQLEDLARRTDKQIMPIFQYRFGHGLQKLKYLVDCQLAGEAFVFNVDVAWWRERDYYSVPWRGKRSSELGGALLSQAIHAVDMVFYILGPARTLFARTATRVNPIEVEDCVAIAVEMGDGSLGTISVTLGSAAQISRHRFTFRNLSAESNTEPYANSAEPWVFSFPEEKQRRTGSSRRSRSSRRWQKVTKDSSSVYHSFSQAESLPVSLADARRVLEYIAAVYYSAENEDAFLYL